MRNRRTLEERVAILEERLKLYGTPELGFALADSTARLRCARERTQRAERFMGIAAVVSATLLLAAILLAIAHLT